MKKMQVLVSALLCMSLLAGCGGGSGEEKKGDKPTLVVSNFALADDKIQDAVVKPFEKEFNCKVVYEGGTNSERLTKLKKDPNSDVDVIYLAQQYAQRGWDDGLFEKLDYSKIPNAKFLLKKADFLVKAQMGPPTTMNRLGILYNPEKADVKSFSDIWKPEFKGKVAIPDISTTFGPAVMAIASAHAGTDYRTDKGAGAFKALAELKPNIVKTYSKSSDLKNMFASGEITVALAAEFAYNTMGDAASKLKFIDPTEGAYLNFNTINIVKQSKEKDLAYKFINYVLSKENQLNAAKMVPESPVNTEVKLTPEVAAKLTTIEQAEKANVIDYSVVNPLLSDWVDQWNRILNQ